MRDLDFHDVRPFQTAANSGLYGRDESLKRLVATFRVVHGSGASGVCIVKGYPGAGKTYLVQEALERMREEGALVASAKFDQYNKDVPYTAIVQPLVL